jgi:hypothetical protein
MNKSSQLANASSQGQQADESGINFLLSGVKGAKPKDQFEAMLSAQMAAIHRATITFAWRLAQVETIPQQDSAERALNKLARTYAMQMEALKRCRTGGEQKVTCRLWRSSTTALPRCRILISPAAFPVRFRFWQRMGLEPQVLSFPNRGVSATVTTSSTSSNSPA